MFAGTKSPRWCCVGLSSLIVLIGACMPPPPGPGLLDGLGEALDEADPIDTFDGEWLSAQFGYAVRITDHIGRATLSNTDAYRIGDQMLVIISVEETKFEGRQIFADGSVQNVIGRLIDPLTLGDATEFAPLAPIFASPDIRKVFHAAEYDIYILKRDYSFEFSNLFDTMVSAQKSRRRPTAWAFTWGPPRPESPPCS